jgi:hypothetical protein
MNIKDKAGLGLEIFYFVQHVLISANEDNCPLTLVKTGKYYLTRTTYLESLRRAVRRLFNNIRKRKDSAKLGTLQMGSAEI